MKKYIIINGVKYKIDPKDRTKALKNDKGEKIKYVEETEDEKKKREEKEKEKKDDKKIDLSKVSLDELKKVNPAVAKLMSSVGDIEKKLTDIEKEKEEKGKKKKEKEGKFQELYEDAEAKRKELQNDATKSEAILGKYKSTINKIVEDNLKIIPEDKHALIPQDYSARKKLEYITENAKILGIKAGGKGGKIPNSDDDINLDEESKTQKRFDELKELGAERTPIQNKEYVETGRKIKEIREANENSNKETD